MMWTDCNLHDRTVVNQHAALLCNQTAANKKVPQFYRIKPFDAVAPYHDTNGMRPAIAYINLTNLKHNFQVLGNRSKESEIMAVVKANAYGHGLELVAPALFDAGCRHFAVTDAIEGEKARKLLPEAQSIVLLSGIFDASDAKLCSIHHLTPVITHPYHAELLHKEAFEGSVWIKINTGMQRLGADDPKQLIDLCRQHDIKLAGIMSHLACADTPEHPLNMAQADEFSTLCQQLDSKLPSSLLNSAGLIALPDQTHDFIRPGIALYGAEPVPAEPLGLKPVMQLTGQVMHVRQIPKGVSLSYGASFTAKERMNVAVVSLGYGDGLPRHLSNQGMAFHDGNNFPIVGRICMDFCLIDCTHHPLKEGDSIEFWGEQQSANETAQSIGTIAYELFTGIDQRVCRETTR
ncbi:MAG: alanine racemase [Mariprofundaceae bacterium]